MRRKSREKGKKEKRKKGSSRREGFIERKIMYFAGKLGSTSAFLILGRKCRFTKIYHNESPARGRTYRANSALRAFFSRSTERAEIPPANQNKSLWSFDATFRCKHITPLHYQETSIRANRYGSKIRSRLERNNYLKDANKGRQESGRANRTFDCKPAGTSRRLHELEEIMFIRKLISCNLISKIKQCLK